MKKSPLTAFLLSFIPGVGHAYLGRPIRFMLYAGGFFGSLGLLFLLIITNPGYDDGPVFFLLFVAAASGILNMLDMIITLISGKAPGLTGDIPVAGIYGDPSSVPPAGADFYTQGAAYRRPDQLSMEQQQEKTRTILLSFFPGIGHMSIGLMQRGVTLLISFVGLFAIIVFLSMIMGAGAILVFLIILPVIWVYSMFDAIQQLHAKQQGAPLEDRSIFEELESLVASGRKNKVLAIALSIFPGTGHLYLGLQKRGLQLMAGFLLMIFIMDNLRLSLFLFLLPLYWCFSFFDALHQTTRYERQTLTDDPVLSQLIPYQRWFGIAMLGFGMYYLLDRVAAEYVFRYWVDLHQQYMQIKYMFPTAITAFIMIIIGLRLAFGGKAYSEPNRGAPPPLRQSDQEGGIQ